MARVAFTANLRRHVDCPEAAVPGRTVAEVLEAYFAAHPRARRYILDDQGGLHRHINVFVDERPVTDRQALSDPLGEDTEVFVFQALSGG